MEHETATLAWLRAEGGHQILLVQLDGAEVRPAKRMKDAALVRLLTIRESTTPRCYDVVTSAGTIHDVAGGSVFLLATPAQAEHFDQVASALH